MKLLNKKLGSPAMSSQMSEIESSLLARQLRRNDEARRLLEKQPNRLWPAMVATLPLLAQTLFPNQIADLVGLPSSAAWFVVFTLTWVIYLSAEVTQLHRQVKALHQLHKSDV
ncbi:hypothetical protein [Roseateles sp.]|uniref:hypothetical protein n=1 Tax=Roseateles sp. TaxID=1971397 RepID=UPI0037C78185